jgi:predicted nucleotidyltransferase
MTTNLDRHSETDDMPEPVKNALTDLVEAARQGFQDDLSAIVLFGSAAEGRLRPTSDVNLLFVLRRFARERADLFREPLRMARVAVKAATMFIMEDELASAADLFAVKFGDIARRHRVLFGELPAALRPISPTAKKQRLRAVLMNLVLRLRQHYIVSSLREEQLARIIAETAGPLRAAAMTLLELEGAAIVSPRASLESVAAVLDGGRWREVPPCLSEVRETGRLPTSVAGPLLFQIMELADAMRLHVEKLPEHESV